MNKIMKFASLLAAAVMLISCGGDNNGGGSLSGELKIEVDKTLIQSDGEDYATLTLTLDGVAVTSDVMFYEGNDLVNVEDFKYFSTVAGDHEIWASYQTYVSDPVTIRAISVPIPETPADPKPAGTDFKSRVMAIQFTGTACGYCSQFMTRLKDAFESETYADECVHVAVHNYQYMSSYPDYAYLSWDWATGMLKVTDIISGKGGQGPTNPSIILDYIYGYYLYESSSSEHYRSQVVMLNDQKKDDACGIAVNARLVDGQVVARVTVKAAKSGNYRVGAMLLEDGISGKQINGAEWMNTHDACVRHIDAKAKVGNSEAYYGHSLGKIEAGKAADYLFIWNLADIQMKNDPNYYWNNFVEENLRMAVFVTSVKNDAYYINNAVNVTFNEELPYEYR